MNKTNSLILSYLARAIADHVNNIALKHENGEFLPEITYKNPHLHKRKDELLNLYCDLIIDAGEIFRNYNCNKETKVKLSNWIKTLKASKKLENNLFFDSHFVEIGENH